ncbi:putative membrane protein [Mycobacterium xenopi 3993]|nr:putative membrane protein [Mycobacterium xenopi 3993]
MPWWAAVVIAVTATAVGFAYDAGSGNKELTIVFAALYVVGCVAAVLAVRQSGVFTAVTQPPLILFCAVPGAYWLFHGAKIAGAKDILINCGYPLIERFPLMLFTSAAVLLLGMVRWYAGTAARAKTQPDDASGARRGWLAAKFAALGSRNTADGAEKTGTSRRVHPVARTKSAKPASGARPPNARPDPLPPCPPTPGRAARVGRRTHRRRRPYPPAIPTCAVSRRGDPPRSAYTHRPARVPQRPLRPVRAHGAL